jgi:hypothetical protein
MTKLFKFLLLLSAIVPIGVAGYVLSVFFINKTTGNPYNPIANSASTSIVGEPACKCDVVKDDILTKEDVINIIKENKSLLKGDKGDTGIGINGINGKDGISIQGPIGLRGPQGDTGSKGDKGDPCTCSSVVSSVIPDYSLYLACKPLGSGTTLIKEVDQPLASDCTTGWSLGTQAFYFLIKN